MAPVLYTIFLADIPNPANNNIKKLIFADDIFVYSSTQNLLGISFNRHLSDLHNHLCRWKVKINLNKCEAIIFKGNCKTLPRRVNKKIKIAQVKINNHTIEIKQKLKYLGIIFSKNMQFYDHVKYIKKKTLKAFHKIKHIFFQKNRYSSHVKSILYKQLIRPIITYGFLIEHNISSAQMENLRIIERKFLRTCLNQKRKKGSFMYLNNNVLYNKSNTERLDRTMVAHGKKIVESLDSLNNGTINIMMTEHSDDYQLNENNKFKSPLHFKALIQNNLLYDNEGNLTYYHRRAHDNGAHDHGQNLVYNINQNTNK